MGFAHSFRLEGVTVENGVAHGIPARLGDDKIFAFGGGMFADTVQYVVLRDVSLSEQPVPG